MRLAITILWCLGALFWLPWLLMLLRYIVDLALGTAWNESDYLVYVLGGVRPQYRVLGPWTIASFIPLGALFGSLLTALGWRLYWQDVEGMVTRPAWFIWLSILVPPLAPLVMWRDARARYLRKESELAADVGDAQKPAHPPPRQLSRA